MCKHQNRFSNIAYQKVTVAVRRCALLIWIYISAGPLGTGWGAQSCSLLSFVSLLYCYVLSFSIVIVFLYLQSVCWLLQPPQTHQRPSTYPVLTFLACLPNTANTAYILYLHHIQPLGPSSSSKESPEVFNITTKLSRMTPLRPPGIGFYML